MATSTNRMRWLKIVRMSRRGVGGVVAQRAAVTSVVIRWLCPKPGKPPSWRSKKGQLPASNSQYPGHPVHPPHPERPRPALRVLIGLPALPNMMIRVPKPNNHCQIYLVCIPELETAVLAMRGVRAWLLVLAVTLLQGVVPEAFSSPRRQMKPDLPPLDINLTSNVEGAKMATAGRPQETLMATGDSRVIISPRCKISNNIHPSGISLNLKILMQMASSLATGFEDP